MKIQNGEKYKIKGSSKYFLDKYGSTNPEIRIEGTDIEVFGSSWGIQNGNPAAMLFGVRAGLENLNLQKVYYGKINGMGELVTKDELEEIK